MKAHKILALLNKVEQLKEGDERVLINGYPCKVDFRIIADDLFLDTVATIKELIAILKKYKYTEQDMDNAYDKGIRDGAYNESIKSLK